MRARIGWVILVGGLVALGARPALAQSYGIELHNSLMPASGGMAGASVTQPQDLQSALGGNPATLTQFRGTQFAFGGAWAEPTYNITQTANLPGVGVGPYSAKSGTPGAVAGNIGVTQDLTALGLPVTLGMGFLTNAGAGVNFREVPNSNGTSAQYIALDVVSAAGVDLTDRLALGGAFILGSSYLDGPFVDTSGMTPAYGLRGTLGVNYWVNDNTSIGGYYQTKKHFNFQDGAIIAGTPYDVRFDHPQNISFGIANNGLADGRLLLAMDAIYKIHSNADFLRAIYKDQWVLQFGAQYQVNSRICLRAGYGWNSDPMAGPRITSIGGVPFPDGVPGLRYVQGQFAAVSTQRITGGVGVRDLLPGLDFDLFAGGMFRNSENFATTTASVESWWAGGGFTWRFRRGACDCLCVADQWCCH